MPPAITEISIVGLRDIDPTLPWSNVFTFEAVAYRDSAARSWVRAGLRPRCGPRQDMAEALAEACLAVHCPADDAPTQCAECASVWPCNAIEAELITLGIFL